MKNIFFFVPLLYTFKTRLKTKNKILSWIVIYLIPVSCSFLFTYQHDSLANLTYLLCKSLISILLIYTLYEVGYIYNDAETIKREKKPTIRLSVEELFFYSDNLKIIYLCRLIIAFLLTGLLCGIGINILFLYVVWSLIPIYAIYNSIRNIWNLPLHFALVYIRYCSIALLYNSPVIVSSYLLLLFPILNIIERASESRFALPFFQKLHLANKNTGRVSYYFILLLVSLCLIFLFNAPFSLVLFLYSFYYFLYRLIVAGLKLE